MDACRACGENPSLLCGSPCSLICKDLANDVTNCGACGNVCPTRANSTPVCSNGRCGYVCQTGYADCNASAADGCETNLNTNVGHCGACGNACPTPANATPYCLGGVCGATCNAGYADCNGNAADGCEANLLTSTRHCGACGVACLPGETCANGQCTCGSLGSRCPGSQVCCGGTCRNLEGDVNNCGACGHVCPTIANAMAVCSSGVCSYICTPPFANCDGSSANGCETNTSNNVSHCGACGNVCSFPNATAVCIGGDCHIGACHAGFGNCDNNDGNGCETDLLTDENNCGQCSYVCGSGETCTNGQCLCGTNPGCADGQVCSNGICCPFGTTNCNNACVDLLGNDMNNCGGCGVVCSRLNADAACIAGNCMFVSCHSGWADCNGNGTCETNLYSDVTCGDCTTNCLANNVTAFGEKLNDWHCCGGTCTDTWTDRQNCGACGHGCGSCLGIPIACAGGVCLGEPC
jgi:hypothetical protein